VYILSSFFKDMYKEKYIASDLATFEQHQLDGWSTVIAKSIRNFIHMSAYESKQKQSLTACMLTLLNQSGALYKWVS